MGIINADRKRLLLDILYGFINGIMVIPVMISFTSIIFKDQHFQTAMPSLVKLVLFSSLVHQIAFTALSSLPFAIGQVQDAGLIFLSAMAADIASTLVSQNKNDNVIVSTVAFTLAISTFSLGFVLVGIGRLKLAGIVQYIPMPVIGGYLAYIGYFCGEAGIAMMAGVDIKSYSDWYTILDHSNKIYLVLPGLFCGIAIFRLLPMFKSPLTLPLCLSAMLLVFYMVLFIMRVNLQSARDIGWIAPLTAPSSVLHTWDYFDWKQMEWSMMPPQIGRWFAMVIVVGFSSCLDVAAIEMEAGRPLDYNKELCTVGWSNVMSGLTGGFTGSYIFTQTLFSLRRGVQSRWCGVCVVLCELAIVLMPVPVTCYIPKFVFGSLLIFIAADLLTEWLWKSQKRMNQLEYIVCIITFLSMLVSGVQVGLIVGLITAMAMFIVAYAAKPAVSVSNLQQSRVQRSYHERCLLTSHRGSIVCIHPKGYVFFGTAIRLLEEVKRHTSLFTTSDTSNNTTSPPANNNNNTNNINTNSSSSATSSAHSSRPASSNILSGLASITKSQLNPFSISTSKNRYGSLSQNIFVDGMSGSNHIDGNNGNSSSSSSSSSSSNNNNNNNGDGYGGGYTLVPINDTVTTTAANNRNNTTSTSSSSSSSLQNTEFVVMDFSGVIGVDATAARSCFLLLTRLLRACAVRVVFTEMSRDIERLLRSHGVLDDCVVITAADDALEWCEDNVLARLRFEEGLESMSTSPHKQHHHKKFTFPPTAVSRESASSIITTTAGTAVSDSPQRIYSEAYHQRQYLGSGSSHNINGHHSLTSSPRNTAAAASSASSTAAAVEGGRDIRRSGGRGRNVATASACSSGNNNMINNILESSGNTAYENTLFNGGNSSSHHKNTSTNTSLNAELSPIALQPSELRRSRSKSRGGGALTNNKPLLSSSSSFASSVKGAMSYDDLTCMQPSFVQLKAIFDEHLEKPSVTSLSSLTLPSVLLSSPPSVTHQQQQRQQTVLTSSEIPFHESKEDNNSNNNISSSANNNIINYTSSSSTESLITAEQLSLIAATRQKEESALLLQAMELYFVYKVLSRGRILFDVGSQPKRLFVIDHGAVEIVVQKTTLLTDTSTGNSTATRTIGMNTPSNSNGLYTNLGVSRSCTSPFSAAVERVYKMSAGSIVGEAEFLLQKPYSTRCFAATAVGLWILDLTAYQVMQSDHPALYHELQSVLLKSLSIANITGIFHLHPTSAYHIGFDMSRMHPTSPTSSLYTTATAAAAQLQKVSPSDVESQQYQSYQSRKVGEEEEGDENTTDQQQQLLAYTREHLRLHSHSYTLPEQQPQQQQKNSGSNSVTADDSDKEGYTMVYDRVDMI